MMSFKTVLKPKKKFFCSYNYVKEIISKTY